MAELYRLATNWRIWAFLGIFFAGGLGLWDSTDAVSKAKQPRVKMKGVRGTVADTHGRPLVGAKVYFIPGSMINTSDISPSQILDGSAEDRDEPLEDIIRTQGATLISATTNKRGKFRARVVRDENYFTYCDPGTANPNYMPGGDASRIAFKPAGVRKMEVKVSWKVPDDATYIGTSQCTNCHQRDYKKHAHKLGIIVPGKIGGHQDFEWHSDAPSAFLDQFSEATNFSDAGVKVLFYQNYDGTRGFDKWQIFEDTADAGSGTVYCKVYLWKVGDIYKVTFENVLNAGDPMSPATYDVALLYGGSVYKQRLLLPIPGRKGRYPFLQYQAFNEANSKGNKSYYDRGRTVFRDYHMDWWFGKGADGTMGTADDVLTLPKTSKTFEGNCAGCHFNGHRQWKDAGTGEVLADAVDDPAGAFDIDGDGSLDEINIGCETCHGPGSKHRDETLIAMSRGARRGVVDDGLGKYILTPSHLTAGREAQLCGRCHDRQKGNSALHISDEPLNAEGVMPKPGMSRADILASYITRKSLATGDYYSNQIYSKKHHPQYPDMLRSKHARNSRILVTCTDCHNPHGPKNAEYKYFLKSDPESPNSDLCQRCHTKDVGAHVLEEFGDAMGAENMACHQCHMPRTAKTGAGRPGLLLGMPTGASTDADLIYWENDISSHILKVPSKFDPAVVGTQPGKAMPNPYTNRCGTCHTAAALPNQ